MKAFFKRLFCKHDYEFYRNQSLGTWYECKKCGKLEYRQLSDLY